MPEHMSPAEVAALRTLMGLSMDNLAGALDRNPRVVRAWESGEYRIGQESIDRLWALKARHDGLVAEMLDVDEMVVLSRRRDAPQDSGGVMPRGWYLAAAGRAIAEDPYLMVEWDDALDDSGP